MEKIWQSVVVVIPIIFVLFFGYYAGRRKAFGPGPEPLQTLNKLTLNYALPASLFVGTVVVSRQQLIHEFPVFLALLISMVGAFLIVFAISRFMFKRTIITAVLQAMAISMSAGPFYGPALLSPVYGTSSSISVSLASIVLNVFLVPIGTVMLKYGQKGNAVAAGGQADQTSTLSIIGHSLYQAFFKTPLVTASIIGFVIVLIGIPVPKVVDSSLDLIGKATAGVAVFICGLTLANNKLSLGGEVWLNFALKNIVVPAIFAAVALLVGIKFSSAGFGEGLLLAALPTAPLVVLLAHDYNEYQRRASATLALTTVGMIVTITALIMFLKP